MHVADLEFRLRTQPTVRYEVEETGYLQFHVIADTFVFLHSGELLAEFLVFRSLVH